MTERGWLTSTALDEMLAHLARHHPSDRRFWLFACAFCRFVWPLAENARARKTVEAAEQYTDGKMSAEVLWSALNVVGATFARVPPAWQAFAVTVRTQFGQRKWGEQAARLAVLWARLTSERTPRPLPYQAELLRDLFGNPFRPVPIDPSWLRWNDGCVGKIARSAYEDRRFEEMPILGDALEDAGCDNEDLLAHCRQPGEHVLGCWVVDALLGKS